MSRGLGAILLVLALLVGAAYAGSPLFAFKQLKDAARDGDRDRLEALIDFPAVRESLRQQVDSRAVKAARGVSGIGNPIAAVLGKLGAAVGDRAVDKLVTPEAISAMVELGEARGKKHRDEGEPQASSGAAKVVTRYAYLTPDRFRVGVAPSGRPDAEIALIMDRRGLFSWRVEEIELPK